MDLLAYYFVEFIGKVFYFIFSMKFLVIMNTIFIVLYWFIFDIKAKNGWQLHQNYLRAFSSAEMRLRELGDRLEELEERCDGR